MPNAITITCIMLLQLHVIAITYQFSLPYMHYAIAIIFHLLLQL